MCQLLLHTADEFRNPHEILRVERKNTDEVRYQHRSLTSINPSNRTHYAAAPAIILKLSATEPRAADEPETSGYCTRL